MGGRANPRQSFFPTTHRALPTTHNTQHTTTHNPQNITHNTQCITHNTQNKTHNTQQTQYLLHNWIYLTLLTALHLHPSLSSITSSLPFSSCFVSFFPVFFFFIRLISTHCSSTRVTCNFKELLTYGLSGPIIWNIIL